MNAKQKFIINWVLLGILFAASIAAVICAFAVKPHHECFICGKNNASEYEFQTGTKKLNGRTYKEYSKIHLCAEDLAKVKSGKIVISYNDGANSFKIIEK